MSRVLALAQRWPIRALIRTACYLSLASLAVLALPILVPRALPVVLGMTFGQLLAALAFGCYLLAVIADAARTAEKERVPEPEPEPAPIGLREASDGGD
jgi:hypothetical protein